jgi:hypothetical protein
MRLGLFFSDNFETQTDSNYHATGLIPKSARSKAWVCGRWLAEILMSNPNRDMDVCYDCCLLSGRGRADHWSRGVVPSVICLNECDSKVSIRRGPWPTWDSCTIKKIIPLE